MVTSCDRPSVSTVDSWAGVDSAWEQEKLEDRKILDAKRAARRKAAVPSAHCTLR